jgi:hypothetical protein
LNTPLLAVRIKHSEVSALHVGQHFDTITDLEATLRVASAMSPGGVRVAFVLTWRDGATFHGIYDLERAESIVEHVVRVGYEVLAEPWLRVLLPGIRFTLVHDYRLEPPDEIIAELQSSVVRSRFGGERTRAQLVEELLDAVRAVTASSDPQHAVYVAALALRLRMMPLVRSGRSA